MRFNLFNGMFMKDKNVLQKKRRINIAVFASGAGSNAQQIINYFKHHSAIRVALIVCNKQKAGVLNIAERELIPALIIKKDTFEKTGYVPELIRFGIDFIVLAGFLWKIPSLLIKNYPDNIINIHPALLPSYGGKGMYGNAVHKAVVDGKEKESGITIHYVDEIYDNGKIIFQAKCSVDQEETPDSLASKIHILEHMYYPIEIERILEEKNTVGKKGN